MPDSLPPTTDQLLGRMITMHQAVMDVLMRLEAKLGTTPPPVAAEPPPPVLEPEPPVVVEPEPPPIVEEPPVVVEPELPPIAEPEPPPPVVDTPPPPPIVEEPPPPVVEPPPVVVEPPAKPVDNALTLRLAADAYQGFPHFTVKLNGIQVGGVYVVAALHKEGNHQEFVFNDLAPGPHQVEVTFLDDLWGGTDALDRNLYVVGSTYAGVTESQVRKLSQTGSTATFAVGGPLPVVDPPTPPPPAPPADTQPLPAGAYDFRKWKKPRQPKRDVLGVRFAPAVLEPAGGDELVGINFKAPKAAAMRTRYSTFGHFFGPGELSSDATLGAIWDDGRRELVQMDVLARNADGSAKHVALTTRFPSLNAAQRMPAMLTGAELRTEKPAITESAVTNVTASIDALGASFDVSPAVMLATYKLAEPPWLTGPLAREVRCERYIGEALRVVLDHCTYADGTVRLRYQFLADVQFHSGSGNSWPIGVTIRQNEELVFSYAGVVHQARGFTKSVFTGNSSAENALADPPEHIVEFDVAHMVHRGAIPPYKLETGLLESVIAAYEKQVAGSTTFRQPQSKNFITTPNMGGTGARKDIGILPGWHADYLMTMDETLRRIVIAQGEAFLAMPVNNYVREKGAVLTNFPDIGFPGMWLDARGSQAHVNVNPKGLKFPSSTNGHDWESAHQPMLPYVAYLITAERIFADLLEKQATTAVIRVWDAQRWKTVNGVKRDWCITQGAQVRSSGWAKRDGGAFLHLAPDRSPMKQRMRELIEFNFDFLHAEFPKWIPMQGAHSGWLPKSHPDGGGTTIKPWMNDHDLAGNWFCWMAGCVKAADYVEKFAKNFIIGRGQQALLQRGGDYSYDCADSHDLRATFAPKDWAGLFKNSTKGWEPGNYSMLWARSLALTYMMTRDPAALEVLGRVLAEGSKNSTSDERQRADALENIRPLEPVS